MKLKVFVKISLVTAIYVVLTVVFGPLSYQDIQFRFSEVLMLLVLYDKRYAIALVLGCFIANLFSTLGPIDLLFGTGATVIALVLMILLKKNKFIASLMPAIVNGIIVGYELNLVFETPLLFNMVTVFLGEFVVVSVIGYFAFRYLEKNEKFMEIIKGDFNEKEDSRLN